MILIIDFSKKSDKERLYKALKGLREAPYQVELKVDRGQRSGNQNKYYWGVVIAILGDFLGYEHEEIHELLKAKFLKYVKTLPNGESVELTKSTKNLNTKEFEDYLERIRIFAALELDVTIPLPGEIIEI
jgi:hypothetical protein